MEEDEIIGKNEEESTEATELINTKEEENTDTTNLDNANEENQASEETNDIKSKADISIHKDIALQKLNNLMSNYMDNPDTIDKTDKIAYWLEDYCRFLEFEKEFKPNYLKSYERGDIVKVNLGYNVGNEEGGLHYCVVVDKHNSQYSGIITVIPLTSDKGKKLHFSEVNLGNEIYVNFDKKCKAMRMSLAEHMNNISKYKEDDINSASEIVESLDIFKTLFKIDLEIQKMKQGSIALVSQITTVSKQRIYDPQKTGDILSGIKISDESLDLINQKMKQLFIK